MSEPEGNTNTLEGWNCPKCGNTDEFEVEAHTWATLTDDGGEAGGNLDYTDESAAKCTNCNQAGPVKYFRGEVGMRRVLIAVAVPGYMSISDVATWLACVDYDYRDPIVWEWPDFWQAFHNGTLGEDGDWPLFWQNVDSGALEPGVRVMADIPEDDFPGAQIETLPAKVESIDEEGGTVTVMVDGDSRLTVVQREHIRRVLAKRAPSPGEAP